MSNRDVRLRPFGLLERGQGTQPPSERNEGAQLDEGARKALAGAQSRVIPSLDGMRGIAVLLVMAFHFSWMFPGDDRALAVSTLDWVAVHLHDLLWSGWVGVDLFFVLSGYLITRGLVAPSDRPVGTRLKLFWMRRVLRIFPLYYATLLAGTLAGFALGGWIPGLSYWFYLQNYELVFDDETLRWTAHFWSLAIEEQFYLAWPLVALTVTPRRLLWLLLALVPALVLVRALFLFEGVQIGPVAELVHDKAHLLKLVYRATLTRADGLLIGAWVAVTQREASHPASKLWRRWRSGIFLGAAAVLVGLYVWGHGLNHDDRRMIAVGYFALALLFASAVSLCADGVIGERLQRFLSWRAIVGCGKISYGMYIFHWPIVVWLVSWVPARLAGMGVVMRMMANLGMALAGVAVTYALAGISFRYFESSFLKLKGKFHE